MLETLLGGVFGGIGGFNLDDDGILAGGFPAHADALEGDSLALDGFDEVHEGDILAFSNAGAYGFSMASNYNSRFRPAEVWIRNGKAELIRERETMEDILRGQVEVM
jgi:hypothetical protein